MVDFQKMAKDDFKNDDAHRIIIAAIESEDRDLTPTDRIHTRHVPRGFVRRGTLVGAFDCVAGSYVGSDTPTPDPPDLASRRVHWAGYHKIVKGSK